MKWGTFSLSQIPDLSLVPETFSSDFAQFELAEELGFDTIWIAEQLFSTYGVVTSTQVLAAALAKATKNIKIGPISIIFESFNSIFQMVAELQPSNFVNLLLGHPVCCLHQFYLCLCMNKS